jgi:hypothetical protein
MAGATLAKGRKFPRGGEFDTLGEGKGRGGGMRWPGRWCLSQRRGKSRAGRGYRHPIGVCMDR